MYLPLGLESALESGNLVLFLGSGIGHYLLDAAGEPLPDGVTLTAQLAAHFHIPNDEDESLAKVAQVVEIRTDRTRLLSALRNILGGHEPTPDLQWLFSLTFKAIYTTNYDRGIERSYELNPDATQKPVVMSTNSEVQTWDPRFEVPIVHLHGALDSASSSDAILITEQDYALYRERRSMLFNIFKASYPTTPILYVGYANTDPNWREVIAEVKTQFFPSKPPQSYRLTPSTGSLDREILTAQGVETIDGGLEDFRAAVTTRFGQLHVEPSSLDGLREKVPSNLRAIMDDFATPLLRMLNSWDYVNQVNFGESPNTEAFRQGNRANWGVVSKGINFERDIERQLVDRLLDFATDSVARVRCEIVLGSAGYGISTLLMAVAAWYVREGAPTILQLRMGAPLTPADVEFAARRLPGPVVFVVDTAAEYSEQILECQRLLRDENVPAFFLLGERLNEWRQRRTQLTPSEHILDPLSDTEIDLLLESLENTHGLGRLAEVPPDIRFSAIKQKNQQQLLVTMREVTEGQQFDAIIEDEYRNIHDSNAKRVYALVCAFSRTRALARDSLIADALGMQITDFYEIVSDHLAGIVAWETVDPARGVEALRARHQIIAEIVWDRCLDRIEREEILLAAVKALNLKHGVDSKAFEAFTRDDESIESLQTFDAKARFFEEACRKDPGNAYVRQHYARMLRREKKYELALSQIESAIDLSPRSRILHHTHGVILKDMAIDSPSTDIGRRRLAQSEAAFTRALKMNDRDEYSYQSLAESYLAWAGHVKDTDESIAYVAKAQETVALGLQNASKHEQLLIVESQIYRFVGDEPARLEALQKALVASPSSPTVRYLLGNALRLGRQFDDALPILREGVRVHPDDVRLGLAYALALHESGAAISQSIGILRLSGAKGMRDASFVATLAGLLVMDGLTDEADEVWRQAAERNFARSDLRRIGFRPLRPSGSALWNGRVTRTGPGFAFVAVLGRGDFFVSASKFRNATLRRDMSVNFWPAFNARGGVAELSAEPAADET